MRGYVSLLEIYLKIGLPSIKRDGFDQFPHPIEAIGFNESSRLSRDGVRAFPCQSRLFLGLMGRATRLASRFSNN